MDKIDRNFLISWKNELAKKEVGIYERTISDIKNFAIQAIEMIEKNEMIKANSEFNSFVNRIAFRIKLANETKTTKETIKSIIEATEE